MRMLAEYRGLHARVQGLAVFRLVLDEVIKKDITASHKVRSALATTVCPCVGA